MGCILTEYFRIKQIFQFLLSQFNIFLQKVYCFSCDFALNDYEAKDNYLRCDGATLKALIEGGGGVPVLRHGVLQIP